MLNACNYLSIHTDFMKEQCSDIKQKGGIMQISIRQVSQA